MAPDQAVVKRVLNLLREWGWEVGVQRLKQELTRTESAIDRQALQSFVGWLAAERGEFALAEAELQKLTCIPDLAGWAYVGLAFVAIRSREFAKAHIHLASAIPHSNQDKQLLGSLRLLEGTLALHEGNKQSALDMLEEAVAVFGNECFSRGRALDALGAWHFARDNFHAALEFFAQAIAHKEKFDDDAGLAVTQGQLGRLYLDWGQWDLAEQHFRADLEICRRISDARGEAQMYNLRGLVALAKSDLDSAAAWLDHAIQQAQAGGWHILEAFARKDRAACHLLKNELIPAREQLTKAEPLYHNSPAATAHANRVWGILLRLEKDFVASDQKLRKALQFFDSAHAQAESARTQQEIARTLLAQGAPQPLLREAFLNAVFAAQRSRRPHLVQQADRELAAVDPAAAARHVYRRVRGCRIDEDSTSLMSAVHDIVTVFFFDLQGFTAWSRQTDPSVVMLSLNQMMAMFHEATARHDVQVIEYMGDGFLAMSRGPSHANRAVRAALDLYAALSDFNRPRRVLALPEFACRIGISTGEVVLGNVGTYDKIDYRAVGTTVNLAARLQNVAIPGCPCISRATWEVVQSAFECQPGNPRNKKLKGIGSCQVWDVLDVKHG
jgi:class 3 adenylate cyclase